MRTEAPCSAKQFYGKRGQKKSAPSEEGADYRNKIKNPDPLGLSQF